MATTDRPDLDEVLAAVSVVQIPMRVRFRGVTVREAVLLRGPAVWGEFSPFVEYDDPESSRWLAAALESAWTGWPPPVRASGRISIRRPADPASITTRALPRFDTGPIV